MGTFRLKFKGLSSLRNKTLFLIIMAATIDGFFNTFNSKIEAPVRTHLKSVYACLAMTILSAATGAYTHLFTNLLRGGGFLLSLLGLGCGLGLFMTPDNGKNRLTRFGLLLGFGFFSGLGTGPLLDMAIRINPGLIPNAFLLSGMIFACFSGAALFAPDGSYLYLGGTLFCGFIMWDTQMIIEKRRRGDKDFIAHSLDLFIDFMQIFRKVLILLMQKEERSNKKNRRN